MQCSGAQAAHQLLFGRRVERPLQLSISRIGLNFCGALFGNLLLHAFDRFWITLVTLNPFGILSVRFQNLSQRICDVP